MPQALRHVLKPMALRGERLLPLNVTVQEMQFHPPEAFQHPSISRSQWRRHQVSR